MLAYAAELAAGRRLRDEQGNQRLATRLEMVVDAFQRASGGAVVGKEVERRSGDEDRSEPSRDRHRLHRLVVQRHVEPARHSRGAATRQHVGRRVETFDVDTACTKIEERISGAATELERRLTRLRDEPAAYGSTSGTDDRKGA